MNKKILLIVLICLILLYGCSVSSVNNPTNNPDNPANTITTTEDGIQSTPSLKKLIWVCSQGIIRDVDPEIFTEFNNALINKGANFTVEFVGISPNPEEYQQKIRDMKLKDEQVDLFDTGFGKQGGTATFYEAVYDMMLEPLNEYMNGDDGQKLYNVFDVKAWESVKIDGNIYGINNSTDLAYPIYLFLNEKIIEKYNIEVPDLVNDMSELNNALSVVYKSEDTDFFVPLYNYLPILPSLLEYEFMDSGIAVKYKDGIPYALNYLNDNKFVKLLITAYDYLNKGYMIGEGQAIDNLYNGNFFAYVTSGYPEIFNGKQIIIGETKCDVVAYKLSDGYVIKQLNAINGIASWSNNKEEAFKLLTMLNTDSDLSNLLRYGILGKQYELVDGKVRQLDAEQRAPGYFSPANQMITHPTGLEPANKAQVYREMQTTSKMSPIAGFVLDDSKISDKLSIIEDIYKKYEVLYSGEVENIEETLIQANQELKDAGIEDVIAEINLQLTNWWKAEESGE